MQGFNRICVANIFIAGLIAGQGQEVLATCKLSEDLTRQVCAEWSEPGSPPVLNTDFAVDYDCTGCSNAPLVEFLTGSDSWVVYSEVVLTGAAANIGNLTIDPSSSTDIFEVTIDNAGLPGAANLSSALMTAASWTGHSSISSGHITGNVGAITVAADGTGAGGVLNLRVEGNATGAIVGETISGTLDIDGTLSGTITINDDVTGDLIINKMEGDVM